MVLIRVRNAQASTRSLHLGTVYGTGLAFAASMRVTEGQYIVVDQMPIQVTVRINSVSTMTTVLLSPPVSSPIIGSWVLSPLPERV
jgi:hypothetical protein